jgi:septal ring factor EnvC (AmiA/AmiB activator)
VTVTTVGPAPDIESELSRAWIAVGAALMGNIRHTDVRFDAVDRRFDAVDRRFDQVDARFDRVESRLDRVETRLDGVETRLHGVETRLDRVETRLDGVEARLDGVEARLDRVETDLKALRGQVNRFEVATNERFDRLDGRIEYLIGLIIRAETKGQEPSAATDD